MTGSGPTSPSGKNDDNPAVQQVLFTGFITISPPSRPTRATTTNRTSGACGSDRVTFLRKFLFHAEVEVNPQERDPFYMRFTDAYVQWNHSTQFAVTVGKHAAPFTQEGATSS